MSSGGPRSAVAALMELEGEEITTFSAAASVTAATEGSSTGAISDCASVSIFSFHNT